MTTRVQKSIDPFQKQHQLPVVVEIEGVGGYVGLKLSVRSTFQSFRLPAVVAFQS
jgi:hypothetical protein